MPTRTAPGTAAPGGLCWSCDREPGLSRRPGAGGRGFVIVDGGGRRVRDAATLERIRRLAIPPAWQAVWICARPDGHLQATGRDARGRKQYRYHPDWSLQRGETKFENLRAFGRVLPRIRARVERALAGPPEPTRERVMATLVRLLDTTWMRIGNPEYARDNGSFGLSTLRVRHAGLDGSALKLSFVGKSGVRHELRVTDRRVARVVRRCRELPGQELFGWVDGDGGVHRVGSADVNAWLADAAGGHRPRAGAAPPKVTAKDFRTWHGSVHALELVVEACGDARPAAPARSAAPRAAQVLAAVAKRLGNTPAVCRKSYVHPRVLEAAEQLADEAGRCALRDKPWASAPPALRGLSPGERMLMALLDRPRRRTPAGAPATPGRAPVPRG